MTPYLLIAKVANYFTRNRLDCFVRSNGGYSLDPTACWWMLPRYESLLNDTAASIRNQAQQLIQPTDVIIVIEAPGGWSSTACVQPWRLN